MLTAPPQFQRYKKNLQFAFMSSILTNLAALHFLLPLLSATELGFTVRNQIVSLRENLGHVEFL